MTGGFPAVQVDVTECSVTCPGNNGQDNSNRAQIVTIPNADPRSALLNLEVVLVTDLLSSGSQGTRSLSTYFNMKRI
jgi:hypothetical protein